MRRSIVVLRQRPAGEPLWTAITHAVLEPLEADFGDVYGDENRAPSRQELVEVRKLLMHPQSETLCRMNLFDGMLHVIAERTGTDPDRDLYPRLVMAVVRAVGDAAADAYVRADPPVAITALIRSGFAAVSAGLPEPSQKEGTPWLTNMPTSSSPAPGRTGCCWPASWHWPAIRPVVLDTLPGPSAEPKANGLVGQVVRLLDMRGLYQAFTGDDQPPQPSHGWMFAAMPLNFADVPDNPMYALRMPQPRLVRLLEKRARDLGVDLRWGHGLVGLQQDSESVALTVSSPEHEYGIAARLRRRRRRWTQPGPQIAGHRLPRIHVAHGQPDRPRAYPRRVPPT